MRKSIMSAVVASIAVLIFAVPSQAGGFSIGFGHGHHGHGYGHFGFNVHDGGYYGGYYEPSCIIKKVKKWDKWGNLHVKKVKICD
jgi:hypothetical protein